MAPATFYVLRTTSFTPVTFSEHSENGFHTVTVWSSFKGREILVTFREVLGTFRVQLLQNVPIMTTEPSAL